MKVTALDIHGEYHEVTADEMVWRPSVYGIVIDDGKILLSPQHDMGYDLPGGGVEMHETFEDAVIREVKEETGMDVHPVSCVGCTDSFFVWEPGDAINRRVYHSVLVYYLCEKVGGELSVDGFDTREREYAKLAEWVQLSEVDTMQQASSVDFVPYIRKAMLANTDGSAKIYNT